MEWEARLGGGERVAGITVLTVDAAGKISAIAIHHRPLPGALRFSAELGRVLRERLNPISSIAANEGQVHDSR